MVATEAETAYELNYNNFKPWAGRAKADRAAQERPGVKIGAVRTGLLHGALVQSGERHAIVFRPRWIFVAWADGLCNAT